MRNIEFMQSDKILKVERYVVKLAGIHDKTTKHGPHAYVLPTCSIETCNEFLIFIVICTYVIDWNKFCILHCIYYFVRPKGRNII